LLAQLDLSVDERLTLDGCLRQVDFLDRRSPRSTARSQQGQGPSRSQQKPSSAAKQASDSKREKQHQSIEP
jgi:hypothetical protein